MADLLLITAGDPSRHNLEAIAYELLRRANYQASGQVFRDREPARPELSTSELARTCGVRKADVPLILEELEQEGALSYARRDRGLGIVVTIRPAWFEARWETLVRQRPFGRDGLVFLAERLRECPRITNTSRFVLGRHHAWKNNPRRGASCLTHLQVAEVVFGDMGKIGAAQKVLQRLRGRRLVAFEDKVSRRSHGRPSRYCLHWTAADDREVLRSLKIRRGRNLDRRGTTGLRSSRPGPDRFPLSETRTGSRCPRPDESVNPVTATVVGKSPGTSRSAPPGLKPGAKLSIGLKEANKRDTQGRGVTDVRDRHRDRGDTSHRRNLGASQVRPPSAARPGADALHQPGEHRPIPGSDQGLGPR